MQEGRADREKPTRKPKRQNPFASTTNAEKIKKKNFMMLKQKAKGKQKRSFKDKQVISKQITRHEATPFQRTCSTFSPLILFDIFIDCLTQCVAQTEKDGFEKINREDRQEEKIKARCKECRHSNIPLFSRRVFFFLF